MPLAVDLSEFIWSYLKTDSEATAVRDLLVSGANSVFEAGDVTAGVLSARLNTRDAGGNDDLALCLAVQDAGEDPHEHPDKTWQYVVIRVYDRERGFRNIRRVRQAILEVLQGMPGNIGPLGRRGLLYLSYTGRTGHRYDTTFNVDYDALTYTGIVVELDIEYY
jgi:hypothetical protein